MSKELEALKKIMPSIIYIGGGRNAGRTMFVKEQQEAYRTIEIALKALEIIKTKKVNVWGVFEYKDFKQYNLFRQEDRHLTKEEFHLLKEILK